MSAPGVYSDPVAKPALEQRFYSLTEDEARFYKSETGIQDDEELKNHICKVQAKAYEIFGYPCIRFFSFTKLKISRIAAYETAIKVGREREGAILLDIGCCFGNDARKAVIDGWPVENVVGSDLRGDFWKFGHDLFKSTPETFPAVFVAGDAFDPDVIAPRAPFTELPTTPRPDLKSLTTLTPLQGHTAVIHASSFFHLFDEAGSMIIGSHGGLPEKGYRVEDGTDLQTMFCHSPESWELWNGQVFEKGTVKVEATV